MVAVSGRHDPPRPPRVRGRRERQGGRKAGDRGSGTLWVLAILGVVWFVATVAMMVGGVRAARHRAFAAADLAALAAAAHANDGSTRACGLAARIARGSGGLMRRCRLHGRIADVWVTSDVHLGLRLGRLTVNARSRAGPAAPLSASEP
jgi:secretion/DNA translocation related TadE-like protein